MDFNAKENINDLAMEAEKSAQNADLNQLPHVNVGFTMDHDTHDFAWNDPTKEKNQHEYFDNHKFQHKGEHDTHNTGDIHYDGFNQIIDSPV